MDGIRAHAASMPRLPGIAIGIAVAALFVLASCFTAAAARPAGYGGARGTIWPTQGWPTSTPEAQGLDSAVIARAMDTIRARRLPVDSLLIERHGHIVLDAYFHPFAGNELHNVYSVTKSVVATLAGIAIRERALAGVNAPAVSMLQPAAWRDPGAARISLGNLLSMTSGLECRARGGRNFLERMEASPHWAAFALASIEASPPGGAFHYCAGNMQLVSAGLTRGTGRSAADLARRDLFAPLGIRDAVWPSDRDGVSHGFSDLRLQPRDMAKLGYLWLHRGVWDGRQIVPAWYVDAALTPHASVEPNVQYGYGMWLYPYRGHAGGPPDFEANGVGGQRIAVVPSEDMVVVITGRGLDANKVAALIAYAPKSDRALPPNPVMEARLDARIAEAAGTTGSRLASNSTPRSPLPHRRPAIRTASLPSY